MGLQPGPALSFVFAVAIGRTQMEVLILAPMLQRCLRPNHEKCTKGSTNMPQFSPVLWLVTPQWGRCVKGPRPPALVEGRQSSECRIMKRQLAVRRTRLHAHLYVALPALPCGPLLICWQTCGDNTRWGKIGVPAVAVVTAKSRPSLQEEEEAVYVLLDQ